jgi:hypothetical protein
LQIRIALTEELPGASAGISPVECCFDWPLTVIVFSGIRPNSSSCSLPREVLKASKARRVDYKVRATLEQQPSQVFA